MKTVRSVAIVLYYVSKAGSFLLAATAIYATAVVLLKRYTSFASLPIRVDGEGFTIFYPFTHRPFLLGDNTSAYLLTNFFTLGFYGLFLWLLSGVFAAFKQKKLFTQKGVTRLSRFYILNLLVPALFLALILFFQNETSDLFRIMLLHSVIGVFAFFMAAIFKQGLVLQEEQDLTF